MRFPVVRAYKLILFAFIAGRAIAAPFADTDAPAPPKYWQYSFSVDSAYSDNLSHPASGTNPLRNYDSNSNSLSLSAASMEVQYLRSHFGYHINAGYGDQYKTLGAIDPWHGANTYVDQAYGIYKPVEGSGLEVDFGKFYTSVGAEVADTLSNYNYSRSLLFVLGEPFYHLGLRSSIPLTHTFTVGGQILNGWNSVRNIKGGKTVGLTTALTHTKWNWSQAYLAGAAQVNSDSGTRHLLNEIVTFTPNTSTQLYVEFVGGTEARNGMDGAPASRDYWAGVATAAKFTPIKKLSFSPRIEFYNDATGATSGLKQKLTEFTGTIEYRPKPMLVTRLEYRTDHSNQHFFSGGSRPESQQSQQTLTLALILTARGER